MFMCLPRLSAVGEWRANVFSGRGTYTFPDGRVMSGDHVDGMFTGFGVWTYPDGRRHEGAARNNQRHGLGIAYRSDCAIDKQGYFKHDQFVGTKKPVDL